MSCSLRILVTKHHWSNIATLNLVKRYSTPANDVKVAPVEEPVKYTTSEAHTSWLAAYNWRDPDFYSHTPKSQRYVVMATTSIFLIYFCFLREENDIDGTIYKPLIETQPGLAEPLLEAAILEHGRLGKSTIELEKRLKEIKKSEGK